MKEGTTITLGSIYFSENLVRKTKPEPETSHIIAAIEAKITD